MQQRRCNLPVLELHRYDRRARAPVVHDGMRLPVPGRSFMELKTAALVLAVIGVTTVASPCLAAERAHSNLAEIHFVVEGVHGKAAPAVVVDGVVIAGTIPDPYSVDPGHHVVVATLNGVERRYELDLVEGETAKVVLDFIGAEEPTSPAPTPTPLAPAGPHANYTLAIVGFGAGAAALGLGVVGSLVAISYRDNAALGCTADKRCPPNTFHNLDAAETWANVSTVSFVAAALGVGVGVVGLFTARPSAAATKTGWVAPYLGPTSAGVRGSF
jgi:hypothetical protein